MPLSVVPSSSGGRPTLRAAFIGPSASGDLALAQEAGGVLVDDPATADVVHVTLDPDAAADAAAELVEERRHVVLHRLANMEPRHATELAARAADAGVVVATPLVHRYYPMVRLARRRVRSGSPGTLRLLHGWALSDSVAAWFDLVEFITSHRVDRLVAAAVPAGEPDPERSDGRHLGEGGLLFTTEQGSVGTLAVSRSRPVDGGTLLVALDGTEEKLVFHEGRPEVLDAIGSGSTQRFQRAVGPDVSRYSTLPAGRPQGHRECWAAYVGDAYTAIRGQQPDGLPTLADLARTAALTTSVRESERSAAWSRLGPDGRSARVTASPNTTGGIPT